LNRMWLKRLGGLGLCAAGAVLFALAAAPALCQTGSDYVPDRMMVTLKPGSTLEDAQQIAAASGTTVVREMLMPDTYVLGWCPTGGDDGQEKLEKIKADPAVAIASRYGVMELYAFPQDPPNDPFWDMQWHYRMINLQQAWGIETGDDTVIVAVIDDGISVSHPDIASRLVAGTDIANGDNDPNYPPTTASGFSHGLHVAGTIAAATNNGEGVAGVAATGVKIMPIQVFDDSGVGEWPWLVDGLYWAMNHGAHVVNMSLGGLLPPEQLATAVATLVSHNVILVAAAGNDPTSPMGYPAAYPGVIAVSAVNTAGRPANYTSYSRPDRYIDLAAPGGEGYVNYLVNPIGSTGAVVSCAWLPPSLNLYATAAGTSMASPHVAGAAALLLSYGVPPSDVGELLRQWARPAGVKRPDTYYGWGILDVYAALTNPASVTVMDPSDGLVVNSKLPHVKASLSNVEKTSIKVYVGLNVDANGDGIPDGATTPYVDATNIDDYYTAIDNISGLLEFQFVKDGVEYPITPRRPLVVAESFEAGAYRLFITGKKVRGRSADTVKTTRIFFIEPRMQPAGMRLFSVPYPLMNDGDPIALTRAFVCPPGFEYSGWRMARWLPNPDPTRSGSACYGLVNYPGYVNDPRGSLFPPLLGPLITGVRPHNGSATTPPAGLGCWLDLRARAPYATPLLVETFADVWDAYDVPLVAGWNMIGDPFPFKVDWNSVMVTYQGRTISITDAVAARWLRPAVYRYTPAGYTYESIPAGTLVPWEGYWVRALKGTIDPTRGIYDPVVLTIPPIASQKAALGGSAMKGDAASGSDTQSSGSTLRLTVARSG